MSARANRVLGLALNGGIALVLAWWVYMAVTRQFPIQKHTDAIADIESRLTALEKGPAK